MMPETGLEGGAYVSERIRADTESAAISHPNSGVLDILTFSLCHTSVTRHNIDRFDTWRKVVEDTDRALYRAKQGSRNGVVGSNRAD